MPVESLRAMLNARVALGRNPGIVAAVITRNGTVQATAGVSASPDGAPLSATTRFEIGSITKVITGTLFADAIARGEVREDERLVAVLPELRLPPGGDRITLLDLATHRSGLPSYPTGHTPASPDDPWADVDAATVARSLAALAALNFAPGTRSEYSNVGAGLLGQALVRRSRAASFDALVRERIATPLGLRIFTTDASPEDARAFAQGHDAEGPVARWHLTYLAAAGAIVSTLDDMTRLARACLGDAPASLAAAITSAQSPRREFAPHRIGLHWVVTSTPSGDVLWHNGGTGGFRSWMGCNRATGRAAVVLTNGSAAGVDDLGLHLVEPSLPLRPPAPLAARTVVAVDTTVMDALVGSYRLAPTFSIAVTRDGAALHAQATGQQRLELVPESANRWRVRGVDAAVEFERSADGTVVALVLVQGGMRQRGVRTPE
jgi:serine-type D-Ala-D-Ala carboxypeptidase/endopeptidase